MVSTKLEENMRNLEIANYKALVKDWDKWIPPGGTMWYKRCTDPTDHGFLVQLDFMVNTLESHRNFYSKSYDKFTEVYMLTRKMIDNADSLFKLISENDILSSAVGTLEEQVKTEHPEIQDHYKLCDFIADQKFYLQHLTNTFHNLSIPKSDYEICNKRTTFYKRLKHALECYIDVVECAHIFNVIDNKFRKCVWKEFYKTVNELGIELIGWDSTTIPVIFRPNDEIKSVMKMKFGYDIETSVLTDELIELITYISKKQKEYAALSKEIKHRISKVKNFWQDDNKVVIRDGSSDGSSKKQAK